MKRAQNDFTATKRQKRDGGELGGRNVTFEALADCNILFKLYEDKVFSRRTILFLRSVSQIFKNYIDHYIIKQIIFYFNYADLLILKNKFEFAKIHTQIEIDLSHKDILTVASNQLLPNPGFCKTYSYRLEIKGLKKLQELFSKSEKLCKEIERLNIELNITLDDLDELSKIWKEGWMVYTLAKKGQLDIILKIKSRCELKSLNNIINPDIKHPDIMLIDHIRGLDLRGLDTNKGISKLLESLNIYTGLTKILIGDICGDICLELDKPDTVLAGSIFYGNSLELGCAKLKMATIGEITAGATFTIKEPGNHFTTLCLSTIAEKAIVNFPKSFPNLEVLVLKRFCPHTVSCLPEVPRLHTVIWEEIGGEITISDFLRNVKEIHFKKVMAETTLTISSSFDKLQKLFFEFIGYSINFDLPNGLERFYIKQIQNNWSCINTEEDQPIIIKMGQVRSLGIGCVNEDVITKLEGSFKFIEIEHIKEYATINLEDIVMEGETPFVIDVTTIKNNVTFVLPEAWFTIRFFESGDNVKLKRGNVEYEVPKCDGEEGKVFNLKIECEIFVSAKNG